MLGVAADRGATILTRTKAVSAERGAAEWSLVLQDRETGATRTVRAKAVVNAAEPSSQDAGMMLRIGLFNYMAAALLMPFFWMIMSSLKTPNDVFSAPVKWLEVPTPGEP